MDGIIDTLIKIVGGGLITAIGSIFYFQPKLREARAGAAMKQTEADESRYESLVKRINSMQKLYEEQGELIDKLRADMLAMTEEKISNGRRIKTLEEENRSLTEKVSRLEEEIAAYKTIVEKK